MKSARLARGLAVLAGLALATGGLTACQTHVGAAAYVGSDKITESAVQDYVARDIPTPTDSAAASPTAAPSNRKSVVLGYLIARKLFAELAASEPQGPLSTSELAAARLQVLDGGNEPDVADQEVQSGYTRAFAGLAISAVAEFRALVVRVDPKTVASPTTQAEADALSAAQKKVIDSIGQLGVKIDVNPRYGTWDPAQLGLTNGPTLPSFLQLASTSSPAANAAG